MLSAYEQASQAFRSVSTCILNMHNEYGMFSKYFADRCGSNRHVRMHMPIGAYIVPDCIRVIFSKWDTGNILVNVSV